jgi:hypothetical protein
MHRNAEIWEKRHERLEAVLFAHSRNVGQARRSPLRSAASEENRVAWQKRHDALERRVFQALSVAKGWRKA